MPVSKQIFSNNGSTLLAAILPIGGATMTGLAGSSDSFTEPKGSTEFEIITLDNGTNIEIIKISKRVGTVFFIEERELEGTTEAEFGVGTKVRGCSTSAVLTNLVHGTFDISDATRIQGMDYIPLAEDVSNEDSLVAAQNSVREHVFTSPPVCIGANPWTANTVYKKGSVITPTSPNTHSYYALTGGTSGATEPSSWPISDYLEEVDNTITWVTMTPSEVRVTLPEFMMFIPTEVGFIGQHDTASSTSKPQLHFGVVGDTDKWVVASATSKLTGPYAGQSFTLINTEGTDILVAGASTLGDGATTGRFYWKGICIEYTHAIYNTVPAGAMVLTSSIPTVTST